MASSSFSDLVDHFKIETEFHEDRTIETTWKPQRERGQRVVKVEKIWTKQRHLGRGSFGEVWLEEDQSGDTRAVKQVSKRVLSGIEYKELLVMAKLSKHRDMFPHFYGWFENVGYIFIAMEYFEYGDLAQFVSKYGLCTESGAKMITMQLLKGLHVMHEMGFTHRSLSPMNIFVVRGPPGWRVKIGDFVIATDHPIDQTGVRGYMAPEVYDLIDEILIDEDQGEYTNAVGIWSLGCVTYWLLTQEVPFPSKRSTHKFVEGSIDFPLSPLLRKNISNDGMAFLQKAIAVQPLKRFTALIALEDPWLRNIEQVSSKDSEQQEHIPRSSGALFDNNAGKASAVRYDQTVLLDGSTYQNSESEEDDHKDLGKLDEAASMQGHLLKERSSILGQEHYDTLSPIGNATTTFQGRSQVNLRNALPGETWEKSNEDSDASMDTGSVFSVDVPSMSSRTSNRSVDIADYAVEKLVSLLLEDEELKTLCLAAVKSETIGKERFQRNFRRLLNIYSVELMKEVQGKDHLIAARLFRSRSALVAKEIYHRITPQTGDDEKFDKIKSFEADDAYAKVNKYLKDQRVGDEVEYHVRDDMNSSEGSSDENGSDIQDAEMTELSLVKRFIVSSLAFASLQNNLHDFVYPSFNSSVHRLIDTLLRPKHKEFEICSRYDLQSLVAELRHVQPSQISVAYKEDTSLADRVKGWIEDRTCEEWEWWPLRPRLPALSPNEARLRWPCACGEDRWAEIPATFARRLTRLVEKFSPSTGTNNSPTGQFPSQQQPQKNSGTQAGGTSQSTGNVRPSDDANPLGPRHSGPIPQLGFNPTTNIDPPTQKELHVFFVVTTGDTHHLAQMEVHKLTDDKFFRLLKSEYFRLRGFFRKWMGVWKFSHCIFYKFEKFDDHSIAPKDQGFPDTQIDYEYRPRPMVEKPPVSKHEFYRRFHACYRPRPSLHWYHKCKKYCKPSQKTLDLLPKRTSFLEEGGDKREIFWGLYAKERPSSFVIVIYNIVCVLPFLIFFFLWLFPLGHSGDLQDASVPMFISLSMISVFWSTFLANLQFAKPN